MNVSFHPTQLSGLSSEQVQRKKESGRQNCCPETATKSVGQILKDNICTLFNLLNVLIALALALVGAWARTIISPNRSLQTSW